MDVPSRSAVAWAAVGAVVASGSLALDRAGMDSATIVVALVVGVAAALRHPRRLLVGPRIAEVAQVVIGVVLGIQLGAGSLEPLHDLWFPLLVVTLLTLLVSFGLGMVLERRTALDAPTAALSMVPGGAIGVIAMTRELGGDDRLVAFSQYLRVLIILLTVPLLAAWVLPHGAAGAGPPPTAGAGGAGGLAAACALGAAGWWAARRVGMPGAAVLGPLIATGAVVVLAPSVDVDVPGLLREAAFGLVGLDVGLRFTRESIRQAGRLLPWMIGSLLALVGACALMAVALAAVTPLSLIDTYLATTPGGLTAVAAAAYGSGADLPVVVAAQTFRMVLMMVIAPLAVRATLRALRPAGERPARR